MSDISNRRGPNFFLLGAAKCGTTSVAQYLDQHPEIFVSKPKEPNFFSFEPNCIPSCKGPVDEAQLYELLLKYTVTEPDAYQGLFAAVEKERAIGEASVRYLYESNAVDRIAEYSPQAKLIVLLRDPVDRLHSHYHMNVRQHIEPKTLRDALDAEDQRVEHGWGWDWHYRRVSLYAPQLQRILDRFDPAQLLTLFHTDLQQSPRQTMRQIFEHLEVSADFVPNFSRRSMVGYTPRWRWIRTLIRDDNVIKALAKRTVPNRLRRSFANWSESKNRQTIPAIDAQLRLELRKQFSQDSRQLSEMLGRKMPW
jgi:hypothetical protein